MKTILRNLYLSFALTTVLSLIAAEKINAQVYSTRANGNWFSSSTWVDGFIPPSIILPTMTVNISHSVTYDGILGIQNTGTINLVNTTGTVPVFTMPSGRNLENTLTGKIYIKSAEYRQYRFAGGGNGGTAQSGNFTNSGGYIEINNSIVEVAENWVNQTGGKRIFRKGVLLVGDDYDLRNTGSIDTLEKVSVSIGWQNNGDFKIATGSIYFKQAKIQLAGTNSKFILNSGTANGDIDYITLKNNVTGITGSGDITANTSVSTTGGLNLDAYCASAGKYNSNGKFTGAQSADCSLSYFPSNFLIQQTTNLSSGLSFTNPQPVGGTASLAVGAQYKFASVNDTTDAIVTIDSLVNGASVVTIDDNTAGTGYNFAFQPKIKSGNVIGRSYAVFTISFYKAGTITPISLQYINATPLDIDGGATLKEFAEVTMGLGSTLNYMSTSIDIALLPLPEGSFGAQNVLGVERDNIDTASYNNMFTVTNTDVSSLTVKYGTYTTARSTSARQFSLYMKGFTYTPYSTLPIKLKSFDAYLKTDNKVDLKWITSSETNVSHFVVERSTDGTNYSDAGLVFAYGNSTEDKTYAFTDNLSAINADIIYYRLRSVDIDGKSQFSEVRIIRPATTKASNTLTIITYPNPATDQLRITLPAAWQNKKVVYELFKVNGQVAKKAENANSSQTETLNISQLSPGMYMVRVSCNGETAQQKIIKQ